MIDTSRWPGRQIDAEQIQTQTDKQEEGYTNTLDNKTNREIERQKWKGKIESEMYEERVEEIRNKRKEREK